ATGGEEQQLDLGDVARSAADLRAGESFDLHEHEGELEGAPAVSARALGEDALTRSVQAEARVLSAFGRNLRLDALVGHDGVHEPEAPEGLRVLQEEGQPLLELVSNTPRVFDRALGDVDKVRRERGGDGRLAVEPGAVAIDDRLEPGAELVRRRCGKRTH